MSRLHLIVIGSLLANAALAVAVFRAGTRTDGPATEPTQEPAGSSRIQNTATEPVPPLQWEQLHELSPEAFAAQLRRHDFAPHVLRAIVQARVGEQFRPRWQALQQDDDQYWRGTGGGGIFSQRVDPRASAARRALWREQSELVRQLLGPEPETAAMQADNQYRYGNLDSDRIKQLQTIESDYNELIAQIRHDSQGVMLQEDRDQIAFLQAEKQADLAALLTPEELTAYELRSSPTAHRLRSQLRAFDATEEEYLALYDAHRSFDEKYGAMDSGIFSAEQMRRRRAAQTELDQEIAALLGPERYADYELKTHTNWRASERWVNQHQLPPTTTAQLVTLERDITGRSRAISETRGLSSADRRTQLNALAQEAETQLRHLLDQEQVDAYQEGPGRWLRSLRPPQR